MCRHNNSMDAMWSGGILKMYSRAEKVKEVHRLAAGTDSSA